MNTIHGLFLPKSYFPTTPGRKTQPLGRKQGYTSLILSDIVVHKGLSFASITLFIIVLIASVTALVLNAWFWFYLGSMIGLVGTESMIAVICSSALALWVKTYRAQSVHDAFSDTATMPGVHAKKHTPNAAQFQLLKQDTFSCLAALQIKRDSK